MNKPLRIYLDSSDFSNLSNESQVQNAKERKEVELQLIRWRDEGCIKILFSGAHVAEAAPTDIAMMDSAIKRFEKIYELCGTCCLKSNFFIFRKEIDSLFQKIAKPNDVDIYSDDGDWFFSGDINFSSLREECLRKNIYHSAYNRPERRRLEKGCFDSSGRIKRAGWERLAALAPTVLERIMERYPMPDHVKKTLWDYFFGIENEKNALDKFRLMFSDLRELKNFYKANPQEADKFSSWLRRARYYEITQNARKWFEGSNFSEEHIQYIKDEALKLRRGGFSEKENKFFIYYVDRFCKDHGPSVEDEQLNKLTPSWERSPGLLTFSALQARVVYESALNADLLVGSDGVAKPKKSDFCDFCHAFYLPYVDIFRADRNMAKILNEDIKPNLKTKIVGDFIGLPNVIEECLTKNS